MRNQPNSLPSSPGRQTTNYGSSSTTTQPQHQQPQQYSSSYQQQQQQYQSQQQHRPQFSVNIFLLRNTQPVIPTPSNVPVECSEPGDLLYGCENDLLDSGTKPLTWGPQPSLHHLLNPKYFCGEALSALLVVRNTSQTATAQNCRVTLELHESAQGRTIDLLKTTISSLSANGQSEFRVFTRIVEPGIYSLIAKVACSSATSSSSSSSTTSRSDQQQQQPYGMDTSAAATKTISVECDRGIEEATRRVVQLPGCKGPGSARFLVMFCLRNASQTNPAALQHVSLVSKDPAVTVTLKEKPSSSESKAPFSTELLNSADIHMTDLLRVPVTTGSSSTACIDSVMQAGEMRQFVWIVDVVAQNNNKNDDDGDIKKSSVSVSAAAALALLTNSGSNQTSSSSSKNQSSTSTSNATNATATAPINIGVVEWQWRRSGGDGGAIRSSMITSTLTAPQNARGELAVESTGVQPSPVVVGEPCDLTYRITNRGSSVIDVDAHVDASNLLPDFLFVGGSTEIPIGEIEPSSSSELRIPVMPIQSGVFSTKAAFSLMTASSSSTSPGNGQSSPPTLLWSSTTSSATMADQQSSSPSNQQLTNVVCMQAT